MGTSTTHTGPKTPEWAKAKSKATRWAKAGGGTNGQGVAAVVAAAAAALAAGGGHGLLGTAGPAAGQRLGGLLTGFGTDGVAPTLERYGLGNLVGLTGIDLLIALIDYVTGDDAGLEEVAVRNATDAVFAEVIDELDAGDVTWDEAQIERLLELFWGRYISSLIAQALDKTLMDAAPDEAERLRRDIGDHVAALFEHHLERRSIAAVDWAGEEGAAIAMQIRGEVVYVVLGEDTNSGGVTS